MKKVLKEETVKFGSLEKVGFRADLVALEVAKELKFHEDARDARVKAVKDAIVAAKVVRDTQEVKGLVETEGAKLDRLAKEEKDLEFANVLNVIEPFHIVINNLEIQAISDKLDEVIAFLNRSNSKAKEIKLVK